MNIKNQNNKQKSNHWIKIKQILIDSPQNNLLGLVADLYALSKQNKDF